MGRRPSLAAHKRVQRDPVRSSFMIQELPFRPHARPGDTQGAVTSSLHAYSGKWVEMPRRELPRGPQETAAGAAITWAPRKAFWRRWCLPWTDALMINVIIASLHPGSFQAERRTRLTRIRSLIPAMLPGHTMHEKVTYSRSCQYQTPL